MPSPNRIPTGMHEADKIIAGRSATDLLVVVGSPICLATFFAVTNIVTPFQYLGLLIAILVMSFFVFRRAGSRSAVDYLRGEYNWLRKPGSVSRFREQASEKTHAMLADGNGESDPDDILEDPDSVRFWESEEKFGEAPHVQDVFPDFDAVRCKDGEIVAAARVSGAQVFLQNPKSKERLVNEFRQVFSDIEFDFSVYTTTDSFDLSDHAERMEDAGRHEAIQQNPILRQIHASYMENVARDPSVVSAKQRVFYVIVKTDPQEVHDILEEDDSSDDSSIAAVSFFSSLIGDGTSDGDYTEEELRDLRAAIKQLLQHRERLMRSLSMIDGVSCEPVEVPELVGRLQSHWQGPHTYEEFTLPTSTITPPEGLNNEASEGQESKAD